MLRTQIQLTPEQGRRLRTLARRQGVSVAEVIRRSVDQLLDAEAGRRAALYERAATLVGAFRDRGEARDVAGKHDEYLHQSYE